MIHILGFFIFMLAGMLIDRKATKFRHSMIGLFVSSAGFFGCIESILLYLIELMIS